jgi:hypothetical protein
MALENWNTESIKTHKPIRFSPLDDIRRLESRIEEKEHDLFKAKPDESPLQVTRVFKKRGKESGDKEAIRFKVKKDINNVSEVEAWRNVSLILCLIIIEKKFFFQFRGS